MESVWEQLEVARRGGLAVLLISSDLDEVLALADRCLVLYGGLAIAQWPRDPPRNCNAIGLAMGCVAAGDGSGSGLEAATGGAG